MKALFLSVKAGYGHHSTAQAMIKYFSKNGWECEMIDVFEEINPNLSDLVNDGYEAATKYLKSIYGKVYVSLSKKDEPSPPLSPLQITSKLISLKMERYISGYKPDVIIGTHSFAAMVMSVFKSKGLISCPCIGIVTDFMIHPLWENTSIDYYVLPAEQLTHQLMKKGISRDKIISTGIPVKEQFSRVIPKDEARAALGIDDKRTVMVMMGSMGFGGMTKLIRELDSCGEDFQVLCVCGRNEKAKKEIDSVTWKKTVKTYGFVDNVDVIMDASDLLVTKPGGLTASEALAKGMPCIVANPIPGQEERNLEFLVNNGCAVMLTDEYRADEALYQLLAFPWRMAMLREGAANIGKPHATEDLYNFVKRLTEEKENA